MARTTVDSSGREVGVGSRVHVDSLPPLEAEDEEVDARLRTFLGASLVVYEVDEWGRAWIEKWWPPDAEIESHSLGLAPENMTLLD